MRVAGGKSSRLLPAYCCPAVVAPLIKAAILFVSRLRGSRRSFLPEFVSPDHVLGEDCVDRERPWCGKGDCPGVLLAVLLTEVRSEEEDEEAAVLLLALIADVGALSKVHLLQGWVASVWRRCGEPIVVQWERRLAMLPGPPEWSVQEVRSKSTTRSKRLCVGLGCRRQGEVARRRRRRRLD